MILRPSLLVFLIVASVIVTTFFLALSRPNGLRGRKSAETVECLMLVEDGIPAKGVEYDHLIIQEVWKCRDLVTGKLYSLEDLPDDFFEKNNVESGVTILTISSTKEGQIVRPRNSSTVAPAAGTIPPQEANNITFATTTTSSLTNDTKYGMDALPVQLSLHTAGDSISTAITTRQDSTVWTTKIQGAVSMLVIRVTDGAGAEPKLSAAEISNVLFGTNGDAVNLRTQYLACSGGKLDFTPATGGNIKNGVLEVSIGQAVKDVDRGEVQGWVEEAVPNFLNGLTELDFDYTVYVMPAGADFRGAGAYAAVRGRLAVFDDDNIGVVLIQMHEVGHNLGMRHSGYNDIEYGDPTCFEGAHLYEWDAPQMCFNAAKSWYLGWYNDPNKQGHHLIQPTSSSWSGMLTGIDAYNNNRDYTDELHRVVLKIETANELTQQFPDLYVMYNRKQGVNKEVVGFGDKVTVVSQEQESAAQSWLIATLDNDDGTDTFRQSNFDGTGRDLVIKVCNLVYEHPSPDYAQVLVYLDDNQNRLDCNSAF